MNFTNNNLLSDLAKCCELAALHERQKDDNDYPLSTTNEYVVGRRYKMAAELYDLAATCSIGHNRSARYEECERKVRLLSDTAFKKHTQRTKRTVLKGL